MLEYVQERWQITNRECQRLCGLSIYQVSRLLSRMSNTEKLRSVGAGRGRAYAVME